MTDDEIEKILLKQWGEGYVVTVLEIIRRNRFKAIVVFYKVKCLRDGQVEFRCKGWGNAAAGWDCVTRRKWG